MPANLKNLAVATGPEKVSFHSNTKERQFQKCSSYQTIAFISHAAKVMLKVLQVRLQQCMNRKLPDVQAGYRKGRGTRGQLIKHLLDYRKGIYLKKNLLLLHWLCLSIWLFGLQQTGKFLKKKVKFLSCVWLFVPYGLYPARLFCPWNFLGQNTEKGCYFLLQGIFLTKGSNPGLLHCKQTLYPLSHQETS